MLPEFSSLMDILQWLIGPGAIVAAGFLVSYVLERFTFWHKVPKDGKVFLTLTLAYLVSFGVTELAKVEVLVGNPQLNMYVEYILYYYANQVAYKKYFKV